MKRQLLRQSRALSISSAARSIPRSSVPWQLRQPQLPSISSASTWPPRLNRRWQSTEAEQAPASQTAPSEESKQAEPEKEDPLKKELEQKNREIIDLKDKYLRSVAEFRNLQERTKRDMESARQFAIQRFATDLLDSIDNLDRALASVPAEAIGTSEAATNSSSSSSETTAADSSAATAPNKDLVNLHSGLKMTESILMASLKKHGLERFDPLDGEGRKFDPRLDDATFYAKAEGKEDGDVFLTQSKGFTLNGRIIRAAKVGVVKNS